MNKITPIITNQRISPYKSLSSDQIQIKAQIFADNKLKPIYIPNIPINLYLNYSGSWKLADSGVTNKFGYLTMYHGCQNVYNVDHCLSKIIATIDGLDYQSNISRINFIPELVPVGDGELILFNDNDYIIFENEYIIF
jgi:hypothetical protein